MCEVLTVSRVCWPVVLALAMLPAGVVVLTLALREARRFQHAWRRGPRYASLTYGPVRLCGTLRAHGGAAWLEETGTGERVRIDAGCSPIPAPGTYVAVLGNVTAREPDPRAHGYRQAQSVWRLRADEICSADALPLLPLPRNTPAAPRRRRLGIALLMLSLGVLFGVAWPTWMTWCWCSWPHTWR